MIGKIKTKGTLTAEQEAAIRAPAAQPAQAQQPVTDVQPKGEHKFTAAEVEKRLNDASDLDALYIAADLINEVGDLQQRAELTELYEQRKFAFEAA